MIKVILFITLLFSPLISFGEPITFTDSSGEKNDKCSYNEFLIKEGKTIITLSDLSCLISDQSDGDCKLGVKNGEEIKFFTNNAVKKDKCEGSYILRKCIDGDLSGDNNFNRKECNIIEPDNSIISNLDSSGYGSKVTDGPVPFIYNGMSYMLSISDQGAFATAPPSCVNGNSPRNDCDVRSLWTKGAIRTDINAIRLKTKVEYKQARVTVFTLPFGGTAVQSARYDFIVSEKPGELVSSFRGKCKLSAAADTSIQLISPKTIGNNSSLEGSFCIVKENTVFYLNIIAVSETCDIDPRKCNSYFTTNNLRYEGDEK